MFQIPRAHRPRCLSQNLFALAILMLALAAGICQAQEKGIAEFSKLDASTDWPWWRGPSRNGFAADQKVPTKFSAADAAWKVPVAGRGHASPTVVGDRIFLATAMEDKQVHGVLAYSRKDGKLLWGTEVSRGGFPAKNHPKNTEASATVASDGELVFAVFYHHDKLEAVALTLQGAIKWRRDVGPFSPKKYEYGYGPSPLIYQDKVIVAGEWDGTSYIAALSRKTGKDVWRINRNANITFSSPVVGHVAGKDQLLISGAEKVDSYDPTSGKPLWSVPGTTAATCGTMIWSGDIAFASGGYPKSETIAVKADGSRQVLWTNNKKCYEQSMIVIDGYVYGLTDNGILYCWRGTDGQEMWNERLQGPVSASPVYAGGHVYWANEQGTLYVFRPNPDKFELVAENHIGTESFASPAICGNAIFLRVAEQGASGRQEYLYCFQ